jgi:threonine dehydrogenase-like Zn-dependent dehydrogenase
MVLGHEFCALILEHGPGTNATLPANSLICSVPFLDGPGGPELIGLTPNFPGGFAELMLLQESRLIPVPNGLDAELAAVTEPLAVGVHAVAAARLTAGDVPLVLGCGPIGLAVIAALKVAGHAPVVASDYSPSRRALAERLGADVIVDPAESDPYVTWLDLTGPGLPPSPLLPPSAGTAPNAVFDCVGAPGLTEQFITAVPSHSRLVVVGVCASSDSFVPLRAIEKELSIQYVFAYRPDEFARSLRLIAEGEVDVASWITGTCGLDGVAQAFTDLATPEQHCKIIVTPR